MNTHVMDTLNRNPQLMRRGRFLSLRFGVAIGDEQHLVTVEPGAVAIRPRAAADPEPSFTIAASPQAWSEYSGSQPRPGYNDVLAMAECGNAEISGRDLAPFFGNMLFVKGVVAAMLKGDASW